MSGYKVVSEGEQQHRCVTPDPDYVELSKGMVVECECGQRWRFRRTDWLGALWERVEELPS